MDSNWGGAVDDVKCAGGVAAFHVGPVQTASLGRCRALKEVRKKTIQIAAESLFLLGTADISCKDLEAGYLGVFESQ